MNKYYKFLIFSLYSIPIKIFSQPNPIDKGIDPGGELGTPGNSLGAPIDDFIPGLIVISLAYAIYKWQQIRLTAKNSQIPD